MHTTIGLYHIHRFIIINYHFAVTSLHLRHFARFTLSHKRIYSTERVPRFCSHTHTKCSTRCRCRRCRNNSYTVVLLHYNVIILLLMHLLKEKHCCSVGIFCNILRYQVVVAWLCFFFLLCLGRFLMSYPIKCNHFRSLIITCGDLPHILSVWICEHLWQVSLPPNPQLFNFVDLCVVHPVSIALKNKNQLSAFPT